MSSSNDAGAAIAEAARSINQPRTLQETLQSIAEVAAEAIPGMTDAGISTLDKKGNVSTQAASGELVWELDKLQYELGEGPCVDSLRHASVLVVPRIRHDQRWPRFVPAAVRAGLKSQIAVKLYLDDQGTVGGLNLYSTSDENIHPEAESLADLFAAHAAIALGHARDRENLNAALNSRKVIGQALGMVMERYDIPEDAAFAFLLRASQDSNIKLRDIAQELVDQRNNKTSAPEA